MLKVYKHDFMKTGLACISDTFSIWKKILNINFQIFVRRMKRDALLVTDVSSISKDVVSTRVYSNNQNLS